MTWLPISAASERTGDEPPVTIARYIVVEELGAGGMGRVYRGYDPELDRVVAIKALLVGGAAPHPHAVARFRREAMALARLAHPGIVEVFEIGDHDGAPYLVMELVRGETLRTWLQARPDRDAVLRVFIEAAEALHAAHIAGVVHRDFKPDNVMIATDGRVRVLDFGLAVLSGEAEPTDPLRARDASSGARGGLTETGALLGTPAYMSPEQHVGGTIGPQSDQFSFCVALAEALYGSRPFAGRRMDEVHVAVLRGRPELPPPSCRSDRRLQRVLTRGLAVDPRARWPGMKALVAALTVHPRRGAAAWIAAASTATVGSGLAWPTVDADPTPCDPVVRLASVYGPAQHEAIARGILGTGLSHADATHRRVLAALDAHVGAWMSAYEQACGTESVEARAAAVSCLDDDASRVAAHVAILSEVDRTTLATALPAVHSLPAPERCLGLDRTQNPIPRDPELVLQVEQVRRTLRDAEALHAAGRYDDARRLAEEARRAALDTTFEPVIGEAGYRLALAFRSLGRHADAIELLESTYYAALRTSHDSLAIDCAHAMIEAGIIEDIDPAWLRRWLNAAAALLDRRQGDPGVHAWHVFWKAEVDLAANDHEAAIEGLRAAQAAFEAHELSPYAAARCVSALGLALWEAQRFDEARVQMEIGLRRLADALGEEHPEVAAAYANLGLVLIAAGHPVEAEVAARRGVALYEATSGSEHPQAANARVILANTMHAQGEFAASEPLLVDAVEVLAAMLGEGAPQTITARGLLAVAYSELGREEDAEVLFRAQLRVLEGAGRGRTWEAAEVLVNLATIAAMTERNAEAQEIFGRTLELLDEQPDPRLRALALRGLAIVLFDGGQFEQAEPMLQEALEIVVALYGEGSREVEYVRVALAAMEQRRHSSRRPVERRGEL